MKTQHFVVNSAQSHINWTGRKVTGAHNGTIDIKAGSLVFHDDQLAAGRFVIDTRSIVILDVTDPATNAQFAGHLASDDFFSSEQYPEAYFEIRSVQSGPNEASHIEGDLTIKGITHPVGFEAQVVRVGSKVAAVGNITVDRTKYGMKFRSGNFFQNLGDTLIYNNFELAVSLTAEAVAVPAVHA
ncbi:YceI family protein [Hymenobacter sp. 15J16-1T3B]|uniref:YceI family protein n=1 Tax=Hymenobacter sp. 15J16-1T3B TaxID=2886941 RepID=UPI001D117A1E|nr:YceI family protein [Hymenobacter sp. 15J16-1T3B]MCC3158443.1 YceI family protein [Hymenobacter sp. 15J16-1T3B]